MILHIALRNIVNAPQCVRQMFVNAKVIALSPVIHGMTASSQTASARKTLTNAQMIALSSVIQPMAASSQPARRLCAHWMFSHAQMLARSPVIQPMVASSQPAPALVVGSAQWREVVLECAKQMEKLVLRIFKLQIVPLCAH